MKNFAARELVVISMIDGAMAQETDPERVVAHRVARDGHQEAYAQVLALARIEGKRAPRAWPLASSVMKLESTLSRLQSATLTHQVMLRVERYFETAYAEAADEAEGLPRHVLLRLSARAGQRAAVLAARGEHACMRCSLDRPGTFAAIIRDHPRIYVCGACHGEVRDSIPTDLLASFGHAPAGQRRAMIVERALGAASRRVARDEVHTALANQPVLRSPMPAPFVAPDRIGPGAEITARPTTLELGPSDGAAEDRYVQQLFEVTAVRARW